MAPAGWEINVTIPWSKQIILSASLDDNVIVGFGYTKTVCDEVFDPAELETVKLTLYVPAVVKTCCGFCSAEVALSPKFHNQDVGALLELSEKEIEFPIHIELLLEVNEATGVCVGESSLNIILKSSK